MSDLRNKKIPLSPMMLAQEFLKDRPWALLATCILLNQTDGKRQVKPMLADFFERFPTPESFWIAPAKSVKEMIRPLGLQNVRYTRLVGMTKDWLDGRRPPQKLHGIGKYATDSYQLFVQGLLISDVQDKELKKYVEWARERGQDIDNSGPARVQRGGQTGPYVPNEAGR